MAQIETLAWVAVLFCGAIVVSWIGRALSARRGAGPPEPAEPARRAVAGQARRLLASFVNWAATLALFVGLLQLDVDFSRALLVAPLTVFILEAVAGAGPGELVAGTRVVDAETGRHLGAARVLVRVVVQLVAAYVTGLAGWLLGLTVAAPVAILVGRQGVGALLLGILIGTPVALVLAEPFFVRVTEHRTTLWDFAARSAVVCHRAR